MSPLIFPICLVLSPFFAVLSFSAFFLLHNNTINMTDMLDVGQASPTGDLTASVALTFAFHLLSLCLSFDAISVPLSPPFASSLHDQTSWSRRQQIRASGCMTSSWAWSNYRGRGSSVRGGVMTWTNTRQ